MSPSQQTEKPSTTNGIRSRQRSREGGPVLWPEEQRPPRATPEPQQTSACTGYPQLLNERGRQMDCVFVKVLS